MTDVYALIKTLYIKHAQKYFRVIINSVDSEAEAQLIFRNLAAVADRFLPDVSVEYLGYILSDSVVVKAVRQQKAFSELYPNSKVTQCLNRLVQKMMNESQSVTGEEKSALFWRTAFTVQ